MLRAASLPARVKDIALRTFGLLAEAEGRVHGVPPHDVAFHEVGAVDSIIDIVGVALAITACGAEHVTCAAIALGTGNVATQHGQLPLPAPATVELLRGVPVVQTSSPFELTTPTGAALMVALCGRFGVMPELTLSATGYGAGSDRPTPLPNVLRVFAGEPTSGEESGVVVFETNIDNAAGEDVGHTLGALLAAGALDAYLTPIQMKKSRPAQVLSCVCRASDQAALEEIVFRHLPTLGIRSHVAARRVLERRHVPVTTPWGEVRVKEACRAGRVLHASPEYEDLRACAEKHGVGIGQVRQEVMARYGASVGAAGDAPPAAPRQGDAAAPGREPGREHDVR